MAMLAVRDLRVCARRAVRYPSPRCGRRRPRPDRPPVRRLHTTPHPDQGPLKSTSTHPRGPLPPKETRDAAASRAHPRSAARAWGADRSARLRPAAHRGMLDHRNDHRSRAERQGRHRPRGHRHDDPVGCAHRPERPVRAGEQAHRGRSYPLLGQEERRWRGVRPEGRVRHPGPRLQRAAGRRRLHPDAAAGARVRRVARLAGAGRPAVEAAGRRGAHHGRLLVVAAAEQPVPGHHRCHLRHRGDRRHLLADARQGPGQGEHDRPHLPAGRLRRERRGRQPRGGQGVRPAARRADDQTNRQRPDRPDHGTARGRRHVRTAHHDAGPDGIRGRGGGGNRLRLRPGTRCWRTCW